MRHPTLLQTDQTVLLIVDYQERMLPAMHEPQSVTEEILKLTQGCRILGVPVLATEQYPKGLGHLIPQLREWIETERIIEKISFSCCGTREWWEQLQHQNRNQIIVTGIESHVCVLQTALDLIHNGYQVHVPYSAVTSRNPQNRENALRRMGQAGAVITNPESILFELMVRAGSDEFKQIQKLII